MLVSLAMYSFEPLRPAITSLWSTVRQHLGWGPPTLEWVVPPPEVWRHPDLLLAQACGWPLVSQLADEVAVVGTFDYDVPGAAGGRYQSVLIGRSASTLDDLRVRPAAVAAINSTESLSGWVSLQCAWGGVPPSIVEAGSHLGSVRAVAEGRADIASIDAVTWALISSLDPVLVSELSVLGAGPVVPCLPLVVPLRHRGQVDALRVAFTLAVADPNAVEACTALRIRGFVPLDLDDYQSLLTLLPPA